MGNYKIIDSANIKKTKPILANIDIGLVFFILNEFMILYCKDKSYTISKYYNIHLHILIIYIK
jgi:hypothetical protein